MKIGDVQEIPSRNGTPFRKRELVLDASRYDPYTGDKYENFPSMEFVGKHCSDADGFTVGELVTVSFFLSGRRAERDGLVRYFTTIQGVGIERKQVTQPQAGAQPLPAQPQAPQPQQWAQPQPVQPQPAVYYPEQRNSQPAPTDTLPF